MTNLSATPTPISFVETGREEVVFDWDNPAWPSHPCYDEYFGFAEDLPDMPARAFVDADGKVQILATHRINRRKIGDNLTDAVHDCNIILNSYINQNPEYSRHNYLEWLHSIYTLDGVNIYSLIHNEYHGFYMNPQVCFRDNLNGWMNCWWNVVNYAYSFNKGATFAHPSPPTHNILNPPYEFDPYNTSGPVGYFQPTNIILKDGYYYSLVAFIDPSVNKHCSCLMRTNNFSPDPNLQNWRLWDGSNFTISGDHGNCTCITDMKFSHVSFNKYLNKYIGIYNWWEDSTRGATISYSLSENLINWDPPRILFVYDHLAGDDQLGYPSFLQPGDPTRNFEQTGRSPWIYYTIMHNHTRNRDLLRTRLRFNKTGDEVKYQLLDLQMNEKRGGKTLDSSFYTNDGILSGGTSFNHDRDRNYLHFDGTGQVRVFHNHNNSLSVGGKITIESWLRVASPPSAGQYWIIVQKDGGPAQRNYGLYLEPQTGKLHFSLSNDGQYTGSVSNSSVTDGNWHHVLVTYDDETYNSTYYIDDRFNALTNIAGANLAYGQNTADVLIGAGGFTGDIDSLTIHNYIFTPPTCTSLSLSNTTALPGTSVAIQTNGVTAPNGLSRVEYYYKQNTAFGCNVSSWTKIGQSNTAPNYQVAWNVPSNINTEQYDVVANVLDEKHYWCTGNPDGGTCGYTNAVSCQGCHSSLNIIIPTPTLCVHLGENCQTKQCCPGEDLMCVVTGDDNLKQCVHQYCNANYPVRAADCQTCLNCRQYPGCTNFVWCSFDGYGFCYYSDSICRANGGTPVSNISSCLLNLTITPTPTVTSTPTQTPTPTAVPRPPTPT
ncbi:LamG domain-containing protein [Candidatus Gottesmanbacteria bacterium]|nr:LamG domain-containing protein [Candidatus Gottesmanbacteria bacterium]